MTDIKRVMRVRKIVEDFTHKYGRLPTERDPDYLEMLRMTKYTIEEVPYFKPGKCANCGSSKNDDRKYVNIGLDLEWYGIVYFCTLCLADIAKFAGLYDEHIDQNGKLAVRIADLEHKLRQGDKLPDNLVKAWEEFKEYYASVQPAGDNPIAAIIPSADSVPPTQSTNETESDKSGSTPTKPRTTKPASISGRKNIPSLADILNSSE